jgi:SAM-dependent methyltransferase
VGCRDGLFAFEAERLGAREVVAIDNDLSRGAVELLVPFLRSRVRMRELNLLDLRPETFGTFDVIVFPGVLYHLRYPFWALKILRDLLPEGGHLVLETAVFLDDNRHAVLRCPVGADSPYEASSCTFFNRKGLTDTLGSLGLLPVSFEYLGNGPHQAGRPVSLEPARTAPAAGPDGAMPLDRATLVCRRTSRVADARVTGYWEGTHRYSSSLKGSWWQDPALVRPATAPAR